MSLESLGHTFENNFLFLLSVKRPAWPSPHFVLMKRKEENANKL
jgi:hypothetical protein